MITAADCNQTHVRFLVSAHLWCPEMELVSLDSANPTGRGSVSRQCCWLQNVPTHSAGNSA